MRPIEQKRKVDFTALCEWVGEGQRVLDLGCGRGILLHDLKQLKGIYGLGVDLNPEKIEGCIKRGVPAYQGDIEAILSEFPDDFFDWVVCSRTLPELARPAAVLDQALRVGRQVAVGFVNHGFWKNRLAMLRQGRRVRNDVFPERWYESRPTNPVSIADFEEFCQARHIRVGRRLCLAGDWEQPQRTWPALLAGYAIYELRR
ncbi:MAG: methionine biosynthesis protein MetW [Opitutales bacterium]